MNDAILVHCDMNTGASCIFPKPIESQDIAYRGKDKEPWISEMDEGYTVRKHELYNAIFLKNSRKVASSKVTLARNIKSIA